MALNDKTDTQSIEPTKETPAPPRPLIRRTRIKNAQDALATLGALISAILRGTIPAERVPDARLAIYGLSVYGQFYKTTEIDRQIKELQEYVILKKTKEARK